MIQGARFVSTATPPGYSFATDPYNIVANILSFPMAPFLSFVGDLFPRLPKIIAFPMGLLCMLLNSLLWGKVALIVVDRIAGVRKG